ncbi:hypothetical protein LJR235_002393 [Pararhizobium sp. LjRoot235]|uniref:hypothetical protein n=1 Tax=Pararhizobium sp. LjRoot235 TaxID=3342291 RepID=UPI003ECEFBB2
MVLRVLPMLCLFGLMAVSSAAAALKAPQVYAAEVVDTSLNGVEDGKRKACVPPDPQYIAAIVRDASGRIIGIKYIIIQYVC